MNHKLINYKCAKCGKQVKRLVKNIRAVCFDCKLKRRKEYGRKHKMNCNHKFSKVSVDRLKTFYQFKKNLRSGKFYSKPIKIQSILYECLETGCGFRTNRPDLFEAKVEKTNA